MQRALKRTASKKHFKMTARQMLLVFAILGLAFTLSTILTRWPYTLAEKLGLDSEQGITNLLTIMQIPALIFFIFLTAYGIQTTIKEYQASFDKPVRKRLSRKSR